MDSVIRNSHKSWNEIEESLSALVEGGYARFWPAGGRICVLSVSWKYLTAQQLGHD